MCGIAGFFCFATARPQQNEVKDLWVTQLIRGKAASGYAFVRDNQWFTAKEASPVDAFVNGLSSERWESLLASPIGLLHARATTKGTEKQNENNHPVNGLGWIVTHNGTLQNDDHLYAHFTDAKRFAAVDTAAINLVLSQGKTWPESLSALGVLTGTATIAAAHTGDCSTIMLARFSGQPVWIVWDWDRKILFWSSEYLALPTTGSLAGLPFNSSIMLPDRTGLIVSRKHGIQRYRIVPASFAPEKVAPIMPLPRGGSALGQLGFKHCAIVSMEQETQGIPSPLFGGVAVTWHGGPPLGAIDPNRKVIDTGYGRWFIEDVGKRSFKPLKSVRRYWKDVFGSGGLSLPADTELRATMDGLGSLERIFLREGAVQLHGLMCPWCGVMNTHELWDKWNRVCAWCLVRAEPPQGPVVVRG